jgi:hypothetical protein
MRFDESSISFEFAISIIGDSLSLFNCLFTGAVLTIGTSQISRSIAPNLLELSSVSPLLILLIIELLS